MADTNVDHRLSMTKRLTARPDTILDHLGTQILARGPNWDTIFGTWHS